MKELDKRNEIIPAEKESKPVAGSAQSAVTRKTIITWVPLIVGLCALVVYFIVELI